MILDNGAVRTLDPTLPLAAGLAIAGDRIAGGVGTHETALPGPDRVDLGGRCVLPGFTDAHVHFPTWAIAQREVRLEGARSLEETLDRVGKAAERLEQGAWLRGRGWRSGDWKPAVEPTKEALDAVTGATPTALVARDGHSLWLNSAALALADGDLRVPGGVVEVDEAGEPTGVLREESAWQFRDTHDVPDDDEYVDAMRAALKLAASRGVVAVHDKDGWVGSLRFWQRLHAEEALTLRVWQSLPHEQLEHLASAGLASGLGDDLLRLGYLKVFMDGTLGIADRADARRLRNRDHEPRGARRHRAPRDSAPAGPSRCTRSATRRIATRSTRSRRRRASWRPRGLRHRIEHAQLLADEDVDRFGRLGVAASVQFSHATSDRDLADRFWGDRTKGAYAYRSLWDTGALVANGSDAPIEELDPLAGLCAGVLRTNDGRLAWHPEQAVTVEQALIATCVNPAWLERGQRRRGKLLPGYLADLVVLDRDPVTCYLDDLSEIRVVATMVGGRWTHNPPPWGYRPSPKVLRTLGDLDG